MNYFKSLGILMAGLLAMMGLVGSASAAQYSIASYFSLPNAATADERAYETTDSSGTSNMYFERSGGIMPKRTASGLTNGPTVPASVIKQSDGYSDFITINASGLTHHGSLWSDPVYQNNGKSYEYDFITPPVSGSASVAADFLTTNLTTPSPMLPAIVDTAVKRVFTHNFARIDEQSDPFGTYVNPTYVHETVTVDDNGGLLFDLTNPANPDYDPAFVSIWQVANGGAGVAVLKGLLKVTITDQATGAGGAFTWNNGPSTTVFYLAKGIGTVYIVDSQGTGVNTYTMISQLLSYKMGAKAGSAAGITSTLVKVQAATALPSSSVSLSGPMIFDPQAYNPATGIQGAMVPSYTADVIVEETPGSGIFKLYYNQGDLVDLTLRGGGYADQNATGQNLAALATASAPNPVPYTLTTPLGTISGKLLDATGAPVPNIQISLNKVGGTGAGGFGFTPPVVVKTDVNGNYSAQVDPAKTYQITVGSLGLGQPSNLPVGSLGGVVTQNGQIANNLATAGSFTAASGTTALVNINLAQGAVINGKLTDTNGTTYANAQITLGTPTGTGGQPLSTITDANGNYSITVSPGSYTVVVNPGWDTATGQQVPFPAGMMGGFVGATGALNAARATAKAFVLSVGTPTILNMQLVTGAIVSGTLTDPNGVVVANAQIQLNDPVAGNTGWASTDGTGNYSATVVPGVYTVQVLPGWDPATGTNKFPNGMTGGSVGVNGLLISNAVAAKKFNLQIATPTIVNMQLIPGATISGQLLDANGAPYANANIAVSGATTGSGTGVLTDATGNYSMTVTPGSYTLQVSTGWNPVTNQPAPFPAGMMGGYAGPVGTLVSQSNTAKTYVVVAGTTTVVNMQLVTGAIVSGKLTDTNGTAYANAQITLDTPTGTGGQFLSTVTDSNGNYSITVSPGSYMVDVNPGWDPATGQPAPFPAGMMGGFVSATGALNATMASAKMFVLSVGAPIILNMQLLQGAVVSGTLTDPNGVAVVNARVLLNDPVAGASGGAITDGTGHYSATVAPGAYIIRVLSTGQSFPNGMAGGYVDVNGLLISNAVAAKKFNLQTATPTIVNMQLIPGATISGQLLDANGAPYANANISIFAATAGFGIGVLTDATGNYSMTVTPGSYTLQVSPGWNPVTNQPAPFPAGMMGGFSGPAGTLVAQFNLAKAYGVTTGTTTVVNMKLLRGAVIANKPPVPTATPMPNASRTGSSATSRISPNDPNAGDTFTYAVTTPAVHGRSVVDPSGLAAYLPNAGYSGPDSFVVTVTDQGGLSGTVKINVTVIAPVVDTVPPVITLIGGDVTIAQGSTYRDAGATALDNVDGNITNKIVVSNLVNSSAIATYTVSYNVKDAAGNAAKPVTRTVNVVAPGGATAVSMAKVNAAPGGTVNVPVTIAPPAGVAVAAFNLVVNYDGNKLTLGMVGFNGAPASWKCSSSMLPPAPSGVKGVQLTCSTAVAADAITASSIVTKLPMTVNAATPLGTVLAISLSPNSKLFDGAGIAIASSLNNGSITVNNSTAVSYTLTPGWNLVAFPLDFGAKGLSDFLAKAPAVSAVWTYKNGQWQSYIVGVPSFMNSLAAIKPGDGYWVKSTSKTLVAMTGIAAPALITPTYKPGWHLVGALAPVSNITTYLTSQGATEIWGYSNGNWCSNISGIPAFMNCLKAMQPEAGYFIKTP